MVIKNNIKKEKVRLGLPTIAAKKAVSIIMRDWFNYIFEFDITEVSENDILTWLHAFRIIVMMLLRYKDCFEVRYDVSSLRVSKNKLVYQDHVKLHVMFSLYCLNKTYLGMSKTL